MSTVVLLCRTDMVKIHLGHERDGRPKPKDKILLRDMKRCRMGGNFFNVLFNLNKFIAFEQRDPAVIFQERMTPELTYSAHHPSHTALCPCSQVEVTRRAHLLDGVVPS